MNVHMALKLENMMDVVWLIANMFIMSYYDFFKPTFLLYIIIKIYSL